MAAIAAVKKRMAEMRDGIDEAESRMKESEQLKREADARGLTAEGEVSSLKNRVSQIQREIDRVNEKLEVQQGKLDSAEGRTQDNDNARKDLEGRETDNDQDLGFCLSRRLRMKSRDFTELGIESIDFALLMDTNGDELGGALSPCPALPGCHAHEQIEDAVLVTENTQKYDDAVNKLKVLEGDLERIYERLTNAQNKVDRLEGEAKQVNTDLKDLETRDEEASEREMSLEEQSRYLDQQVKETDQRADQAERMVAKLERLRDTLIGSIELEKKKTETSKDELEATMHELLEVSSDGDKEGDEEQE
ncbi:tropomyosin-like [Dendronephthya gigantea]|uniref:tropomyosin-like n=1 Tax=Dendronephthya gigantea TaxID=151771 RepID=UPI001069B41B|nr:tropomyosin-like [Dendronephthya gigantea]